MFSQIELRGRVSFPPYHRERIYMRPFITADDVPKHWQSTVECMLDGIDSDVEKYLMVDCSFVPRGHTQRRPGVHIDGYWEASIGAHRGPVHTPGPSRHTPGRHRSGGGHITWAEGNWDVPETILLASSVQGAVGYRGDYQGEIGEGGDCSSIDLTDLEVIPFPSHLCCALSVNGLHESVPLESASFRQLVRINVPDWSLN